MKKATVLTARLGARCAGGSGLSAGRRWGVHRCGRARLLWVLVGRDDSPPASGSAVPAAAVGLLVADGQGNFTESVRTLSVNGSVSHQTATGTYTVNRDGTGSATFHVTFGPGVVRTETFDFVIVNNDSEAHFIGTDPGVVIRGVAIKQ
jgi:hypothetical protein